MSPDLLPPLMAAKVTVDESGCWLWKGARNSRGYGCWSQDGQRVLTHRVAYERLVGPIPQGLQIDHLCRVKACCRPDHLEPVTAAENSQRRVSTISHCAHGHPLKGANLYVHPRGSRECRICRAAQFKAAKARRQAVTA